MDMSASPKLQAQAAKDEMSTLVLSTKRGGVKVEVTGSPVMEVA